MRGCVYVPLGVSVSMPLSLTAGSMTELLCRSSVFFISDTPVTQAGVKTGCALCVCELCMLCLRAVDTVSVSCACCVCELCNVYCGHGTNSHSVSMVGEFGAILQLHLSIYKMLLSRETCRAFFNTVHLYREMFAEVNQVM